MIKMLIVDDEDFIRQGMRYTIPWETYDIKIVGEAANGAEALQLAVRLQPDIILADIQMPIMGGLELANRLSDLIPDCKVIILTAYGNTENLTTAIDVHVSAFVLKSADSQKILDTVLHVKKEVETLQKKAKKADQLYDIYEENRQLIKSTLFSRFLLGQISYLHFLEKAPQMDIAVEGSSFSLLLIKSNCKDEKLAIGSFLRYFSRYHPLAFFIEDQISVIILRTIPLSFTTEQINHILPSIQPLTFGNCIVIMNDITSMEDFPFLYPLLLQSLDYCFWNPQEPYLLLTAHDKIKNRKIIPPYSQESALISAIISHDVPMIHSMLELYYAAMSAQKISRNLFMESIKRLTILISATSSEEIDIPSIQELASELETPSEILALIASLALPSPSSSYSNSQISLALTYISEHYTQDLYLEEVAKVAYLSPGYLSRIFKNETGYSFKEYIHKLRIQKAQQLIRDTTLKYYEIAEQIGYRDYKYFSSYFSKLTGCSAKEYRRASITQTRNA